MLAHPIIKIEFINQENKNKYKANVLNWLKADFNEQEQPGKHFWHNRKRIAESFNKCQAMVALNEKNQAVGYMTWDNHSELRFEIDIVEVKKDYRRQGLLKKMLELFLNKFADISILTACVIPEAQKVFVHLGWEKVPENNLRRKSSVEDPKYYFNLIKPGLVAQKMLVNGPVIAVCPVDYYQFINNRDKYTDNVHYFPIDLDESWQLKQAIIVPGFNYEHYIGLYYDKALILEGKGKHLFEADPCHRDVDILIISKIIPEPSKKKLFDAVGFLPKIMVNAFSKPALMPSSDYKTTLSSAGAVTFFPPSQQEDEKPIIIDRPNKRSRDDDKDEQLTKKLHTAEIEDTKTQQTLKFDKK